MAWAQRSRRHDELPPNWASIRHAVLKRDAYTCQIRGPRCTMRATHVDHTDNAQGPSDHRLEVLRAACQPCHMGRTARQAHLARAATKRQPAKHPGLL